MSRHRAQELETMIGGAGKERDAAGGEGRWRRSRTFLILRAGALFAGRRGRWMNQTFFIPKVIHTLVFLVVEDIT